MDPVFGLVIEDNLNFHAGERYSAYMSEAQQMVSEFGQSLTPECESQESFDDDLSCPATLYLSGRCTCITVHCN